MGIKMQKNVFVQCAYLREKWINLHQTKTVITGPFERKVEYISPAEMLWGLLPFVISVCLSVTYLTPFVGMQQRSQIRILHFHK